MTDPTVAVGDSGWVERVLGRADEVRHPEPGSRWPKVRLLGSRDFR